MRFCGITKEHFEAWIYWCITCWRGSRRAAGRASISYMAYKPLRNNLDEENPEEGEVKEGEGENSVPNGEKPKSRIRAAASAVVNAPRNIYNKIRNNLTIQQEKKEQEMAANPSKYRTKRDARKATATVQHKDELIDESDGDYENMAWTIADRDHERGTWMHATVTSSMHSMQRS